MGKADTIRANHGASIRESIGVGLATGRATIPIPAALGPAPTDRLQRDAKAFLVPLTRIERDPNQPRKIFDEGLIEAMAESLKQHGQIQPVRVIHDTARDVFILVCGERRWRAASVAGIRDLSVIVEWAGNLTPAKMEEMRSGILLKQFIENEHREGFDPIERADAIAELHTACRLSTRDIHEKTGQSQTMVATALIVARLPEEVRELVRNGRLALTAAPVIARLEDPERILRAATVIVAERLNRDGVKALVDQMLGRLPAPAEPAPTPEPISDLVSCGNSFEPAYATESSNLSETTNLATPTPFPRVAQHSNATPAKESTQAKETQAPAPPEREPVREPERPATAPAAKGKTASAGETFLGNVGGQGGAHSYRIVEFGGCIVEARWPMGGPNDLVRFRDALIEAVGRLNEAIADDLYRRQPKRGGDR